MDVDRVDPLHDSIEHALDIVAEVAVLEGGDDVDADGTKQGLELEGLDRPQRGCTSAPVALHRKVPTRSTTWCQSS